MVPGPSFSPGTSAGKPLSPHTSHTPAVSSRLRPSEVRRSRSRNQAQEAGSREEGQRGEADGEAGGDNGTTAIDIPSPNPWAYGRRSGSVHGHRGAEEEQEYGPRPYSLPVDDRDLSVGDLGSASAEATASDEKMDSTRSSDDPSPAERPGQIYSATPDPSSHGLLSRGLRGARRGSPFGHSYSPSSSGQAGASTVERFATSERGNARGPPSSRNSTTLQDDEGLMFAMSDMQLDGRRSLEEGKESSDRGGFRGARGLGWR